ncbi:hypothetical protein GOB57_21825 [Sinorhizobium meliloti]|nr:hypothetical protein [Sinorhizobium meliloti]
MSLVDSSGLGELTVVEHGEDSVVSDRNGNTVATFHGLFGSYNAPAWEAFIDGLQIKYPKISVFNESQGKYHLCMGDRWLESEGRYESEALTVPTLKP